ncbi:precorrin-6y C5,15-methyltransferase (decarboxylating) subunit CbiE [Nocardioides panacisoli]|uniref:Bifunctional cobalt-precorrin-7 (C(5))-methyltransferase/cobalt-precorrin-6B (C(15))-methyltransferase n=1 Tax=Nocardioides panacisoli TaxID=627624 RepID=A0ABP7INM3_9ACTN
MTGHVTVVGIGADGWAGLAEPARAQVLAAGVLLGGERHLVLVPPVDGQVRRPWPRPLTGVGELVAGLDGRKVVALASGDPMVSGIGTTLAGLGVDVTVLPTISSVALARARMRWSAESSEVLTLVGRDPDVLRRELTPGRRLLVLSADESTPATVAALLRNHGFGATRMTVLGDLGSDRETRHDGHAEEAWAREDVPRLHVLALEVAGPPANSWAAGLPDEAYEHDGQLTKRDVRASALARLRPQPGALLWDVGAGAGSVGIEWLRSHRLCRAVAVEGRPERAARIARNAGALGVPSLDVVHGRAPDALLDLPDPDAVFVGGGATTAVLDLCRDRLRPGGRLVAHGVTLETERLLLDAHDEHGGELVRLSVEQAAPLGDRFRGWSPARAVTQWAWTKETR